MPIRTARSSDLHTISSIVAAAFWDEDAVGRFMHPYREKYPQDYQEWWKRRILGNWWDYKYKILVSEDENGEVTGFAEWVASGTSAEKVELWKLDPRNLLKPITSFYNKLVTLIWPNRAADPKTIDSYAIATPFFAHHWTGPRANGWQLETLAVNPKFQGQGYGRELAVWGLEKAKEERVPASVISSDGNEKFYLKCGFDDPGIIGCICEGEGNPLNRIKGGMILFKDPAS